MIFRYNEKSGEYKKVSVELSENKIFLTIIQGIKQQESKTISLSLTIEEALRLATTLEIIAKTLITQEVRAGQIFDSKGGKK